MKKNNTQESFKALQSKDEKVVTPSQSTLNFLKLFARTYYSDKTLSEPFDYVCIN